MFVGPINHTKAFPGTKCTSQLLLIDCFPSVNTLSACCFLSISYNTSSWPKISSMWNTAILVIIIISTNTFLYQIIITSVFDILLCMLISNYLFLLSVKSGTLKISFWYLYHFWPNFPSFPPFHSNFPRSQNFFFFSPYIYTIATLDTYQILKLGLSL